MYWPKPKIEHGTTTYYVTKKDGTTTHGPTGDVKVTTPCVTLKHWPLYLGIFPNDKAQIAVGITGTMIHTPHLIHLLSAKKCFPLAVIEIAYGWSKIWWKPWVYCKFH